jgi:aspartate ammonia-lyase
VEYRIEKDSLGEVKVPAEAYWGAQTQRAVENFPISGLKAHPRMIEAYVMIKKAAALAHKELDLLEEASANAIVQAANEVLRGEMRDHFVVDVYQAGAGTSFNMNSNEVLANRANEILGGKKGDNKPVHPNDHVNMGQSTNDSYPTAMRVATRLLVDELMPALDEMELALSAKAKEFDHILKSGRTHLQDAVPVRLGQEFAAYAATVYKCKRLLHHAATELEELGIGGSAAGTGLNTHPQYRLLLIDHLRDWTKVPFRPAEDMREAMQSNLPMGALSGALRNLALELTRVANDFRLLSSGPLTGFAEITLPAVQPGSSIMPGKVNPVIAECLDMICFQVIGLCTTLDWAVQAGQLELNVMMPVMAWNAQFGLTIMTNGVSMFTDRCIRGIVADEERCRHYAEISPSLATALNPHIGYLKAAEVVKQSLREKKTVPQVVLESGLMDEAALKKVLDAWKMTEPGIPGRD